MIGRGVIEEEGEARVVTLSLFDCFLQCNAVLSNVCSQRVDLLSLSTVAWRLNLLSQ
jgi:hypothetical protein